MKEKTDVNYYSGDKIDDLIQNTDTTIEKQEGDYLTRDKNYSDDMYSEDQLKLHDQSNMNVFTVDGVPSRWEHNKLRSSFHFDPMAPADPEIIQIPCRLEADWTDAINYSVQEAKEMTIGNYRPRHSSRQDQDLHDGELQDIKRATGSDADVSNLYHDHILGLKWNEKKQEFFVKRKDVPEYDVCFKAIDALGIDVHQSRIHIQKLGQVTPIHIDQQMRYARPGWRKIWLDGGGDKDPLRLRRFLIHLQDWEYGHVWQFGNYYHQGYKSGTVVTYDWCNVPHGTANFGFTPRLTFQITGFISDKTRDMIADPDPERVIKL